MRHFVQLAVPAPESIDTATVREAGGEFASYIDTESASPLMAALRAALEAPMHSSQVLNAGIALSNVVGLLALSLAEDQSAVADFVTGPMARSAAAAFPDLVAAKSGDDEAARDGAEAMVCRVFGVVELDELPDAIDGRTLAAIAAYGDAGIMLADGVGLPRQVLAGAIGQAAAQM